MITKEQFARGFTTIESYYAMVADIHRALKAGGISGEFGDVGGQALLDELIRQLEERCNAVAGDQESLIEYALFEPDPFAVLPDGRRVAVRHAEEVWSFWEVTMTGPFSQETRL